MIPNRRYLVETLRDIRRMNARARRALVEDNIPLALSRIKATDDMCARLRVALDRLKDRWPRQ